MIKLTLEECKSFKFSPIQYELEEIRIRELNVNLIYNLIDISQDENSLNILNRNDLQNIKDLALEKMMQLKQNAKQNKQPTDNIKLTPELMNEAIKEYAKTSFNNKANRMS